MNEQDLLKHLNLSEADLQDFVTKLHQFVSSLNPRQRAALEASLPSLDEVAKLTGADVTAEQLTNYVAKRLPATGPTTALLFLLAAKKTK